MDASAFDEFARILSAQSSRRAALKALAGTALAGFAVLRRTPWASGADAPCACGPALACAPDGSCRQCLSDADCPVAGIQDDPTATYHCTTGGQCQSESCPASPNVCVVVSSLEGGGCQLHYDALDGNVCAPSADGCEIFVCTNGQCLADYSACPCDEGYVRSPISGECILNGTCPSGLAAECEGKQQVCCGPETDKPGLCEGRGQTGGDRACYTGRTA